MMLLLVVVLLIPVGIVAWALIIHPALANVPEGAYVSHNEQLLRSIPVYRTAKLVNSYSIGQPNSHVGLNENGPPYGSYNTWNVYDLPRTTDCTAVGSFYRSWFARHGWKRETGWDNDPRSESLVIKGVAGVDFSCFHADATRVPSYSLDADYKQRGRH